jgi:mitochondrial fission protein ELM1
MRSTIISAPYAGLQNQALGLAEAAGLAPELRVLAERAPWRWLPPVLWPAPLAAFPAATLAEPLGELVIGCGGMAGVVGAALRRRGRTVVQVQNPRIPPARFDLVVANRHDELTGPNVIVTRTALHRVTRARLDEAAQVWGPRLEHLPRPLVAVLVGGSNGRYRLDADVGAALAEQLAGMLRLDGAGLAVTPSRRTEPAVVDILAATLEPLGGYVWRTGENPYFGLLALADAIVVTQDSISMVSEAVATRAPVMLATLPGRSRRQALFIRGLSEAGRVRPFAGRLESWAAEPIDDTDEAAAEMRRRLGF